MLVNLDCILPEELVSLRPMETADIPRVIDWVTAGRRAGTFFPGSEVTVPSLLEYQARFAVEPAQYRCLIVELHGAPIGYIDFRYRSLRAEILGIFLEPTFRRRRFGRHLLR